MSDLHLIQLSLSLPRLIGFYGRIWPRGSAGTRDEKFLIKTALSEVMVGDAMPRPWRIQHRDHDGTVVVLGYSKREADVLRDRIDDAMPELSNAFDRSSLFSKPLRAFRKGERLQLQSHFNTMRMARSPDGTKKTEVEVWTYDRRRREREGLAPRDREEVYREFFAKCVSSGVEIVSSRLTGMDRHEFARKDENAIPTKATSSPVVDVEAICEVTDPDAFRAVLENGIGRSRVYGCGMVLVRAAA